MGNQLNKSEKILIRIHFEAEENVVAKAASMLQKHPEQLNSRVNSAGDTLLHYAVYHKKEKLLRLLLECGADRHIANVFGLRPLDLVDEFDEEDAEARERIRKTLLAPDDAPPAAGKPAGQ